MPAPYGIFLTGDRQIAATGGTIEIVSVPCYATGYLRHLLVNDLSVSAEGYTVDIYCSSAAFNGDLTALSSEADSYTVIGRQTVTVGNRICRLDGEYPFVNADGGHTERERKIYLVITPAGSGAKIFDVVMFTEAPVRD